MQRTFLINSGSGFFAVDNPEARRRVRPGYPRVILPRRAP